MTNTAEPRSTQAQLGSTETNLVEFLLARYAELDPDDVHDRGCDVNSYVPFPCNCGVPDRMLADIEAKRRIVATQRFTRLRRDAPQHSRGSHDGEDYIRTGPFYELRGADAVAFLEQWYEPAPPTQVLKLLALPYVDHPDYRAEWGVE